MKRLFTLLQISVLFLFLFNTVSAQTAKTLLIEAEHFDDYGGWVHDSQFMDQMGSTFLLAHIAGKRESQRLMGDEFISVAHYTKYPSPYWIPYRCLYSRNIENLFMAGRDISTTHEGLGTSRVMRTGGCMGEIVGMAASLCEKHGTTPHNVYQVHLTELKSLMDKGVALPPKPKTAREKSLYEIPADLIVPAVVDEKPQAGKRVRLTTPNWEKTNVYHTLYLPPDWTERSRLPVIVEYAGNGGYRNGQDVSDGTVEGCMLGYGLTAGKNAIWICLPFVKEEKETLQNCKTWWGNVDKTKQYCVETVEDVCRRFGGDSQRVILAGFSRGSIACFYIGLHDDKIARLWAGFFCHSHIDGVNEKWGYAGADRVSALTRLKRLGTRPVWFSQEGNIDAAKHYLKSTGLTEHVKIEPFPYPNHTAEWILRDLPIREKARLWLRKVNEIPR